MASRSTPRLRTGSPVFQARSLARPSLLGLSLALAACSGGSGNGAPAAGGGGGGGSLQGDEPVAPDFALREDVQLTQGSLGDALLLDLDQDGIHDLVETNVLGQQITIAMGDGDGTYTTVAELPTLGLPWKLAAGHVDGDGLLDLAVVTVTALDNFQLGCTGCTPQVLLLQQDDLGFYSITGQLDLPAEPFDLTAGPALASGFDELIVTLPELRETWIVRPAAGGLLEAATVVVSEPTGGKPLTASLIDADGDAALDLAVGEYELSGAPDRVVLYRGTLGGPFVFDSTLLPFVQSPVVRSAGDVDGDGWDDLSVAQMGSTVGLFAPGSAGGFTSQVAVDFGAPQSSLLFRDLDGDGLVDAAASLFEDGAILIRSATAPGEWQGDKQALNVGALPRSLDAPDLFGDGLPDLFVGNQTDVSLAHATGQGQWRAAQGFDMGSTLGFLETADFDGDGALDVVGIDLAQRRLVFLQGDGAGGFSEAGTIPLESGDDEVPGYLALGDFDEDGTTDIATTLFDVGVVQLVRSTGDMPMPLPSVADRVTVGTNPAGIAAALVDGDGHQDLLVANSGDQTVQLLRGDGHGEFTADAPFSVPFRPIALRAADLDLDGDADLVVSAGDIGGADSHLLIYAGNGDGGFSLRDAIKIDDVSGVIEIADLNEDGQLDLVVAQSTADAQRIFVMLNQGLLAFTSTPLFVGADPGTVEVADVNRDGNLDLLVPLGIGELRLALGDGEGNFPQILPLVNGRQPVPFGTVGSSYADVDGDGMPDLLLVSTETPFLWVGRNVSAPLDQ